MTMRFIKRKAFRLKVWKTLNAVVGVVTILNVSLIGTLFVPQVAEAVTAVFQDNFESHTTGNAPSSPWSEDNGVRIVDLGGSHDKVLELNADSSDSCPSSEEERVWATVNTTGFDNIVMQYDRHITDTESNQCDEFKSEWRVGTGSWTALETVGSDSNWSTKTYGLPASADNVSNLQIRFKLKGTATNDKAYVDNVKVESRGYTFALTSPTPPTQTDTFTWTLDGEKPGSGQEISHFSLQGCWEEKDIKSVSITENPPAESDDWDWDYIDPPSGPKSIKINNLNDDNDLPALITVVFNQSYLSNGAVTGWIKQGRDLVSYQAGGPNCDTPRDPVTINAWKVICPSETDLPNWGTNPGGPNITATTAADFVAANPQCSLAQGWDFQWGYENVVKDAGDHLGPATTTGSGDAQWKNFDTTSNGATPATVSIATLKDFDYLWVRENLQAGYIPFANPPGSLQDSNSAELYCHTDVFNYDNYDRVDGVQYGGTYNCVAFNVLKTYSIHGFKWYDWDGNGKWGEESTLNDWKIFIDQNGNGVWDDGEPWTLTNSDGYSFDGLTAGQYRICEVGQTGWQQTYPIDSELNNCHTVNLPDENSEAQYNFGNEQLGSVTIHKQFDDNGDGVIDRTDPQTGWSWDVTNGPQDNLAGATVYLDKGPTTVTEDAMTGFTSTWFCSNQYENSVRGVTFDGYQAATVDQNGTSIPLYVWPGQNLDCTFVNTRDMGTVTVLKNVDTDGNGTVDVTGATDWTWDVTGGEQDVATGSSRTLGTGSVTVSEDQKADFHVTGLACTVNREPITVPLGTSATFDLTKGANVVCTFTNTRDTGTLTVNKSYDDNSDSMVDRTNPSGWTWDIVNGSQNNAGGASQTLLTGSYTVNEDAIAGYNSAWSCTNQTSGTGTGLTVALTSGQNVVCTFTNTKRLTVLGLEKTADPTTVNPTKTVTYTMKWSVAGNTQATNVILTDPIPANVTFVSADNGGTNVAGAVTWNLGTKAPGTNGEVHWVGTVAADVANGTVIPNTAMIDSAETDPVFSQAATITVVVPQVLGLATNPALTITKTVDQKTAEPNDVVTYSIVVKNTGDGDAMNVTATDTLPLDLSFVEGTGRTRTWDLGTIPPGGAQTVTVDVRVERDAKRGDYVNTATATATDVDPVQAEATLTVKTPKVLGLATTGVSGLDRLIALAGLALVAFGLFGLRRPKLLRPKA